MSLENLKIEIDPKYSRDFIQYLPKKKNGHNDVSIFSIENINMKPNERKIISLNFKLAVDQSTIFMITSYEPIARQNGIMVIDRVISSFDKDYINITLWNTTQVLYMIKRGDIIASGYVLSSPWNYEIQVVKKV